MEPPPPPPPTPMPITTTAPLLGSTGGGRTLKRKEKRELMMDPDVIEIPPPPPSLSFHRTNRGRNPKNNTNSSNGKRVSCPKPVQVHEVIDIDDEDEDYVVKHEDLMDVMILDDKMDAGKKGKGVVSDGNAFTPSKEIWNYHQSSLVENSAVKSNNSISVDDYYTSYGDTFGDADMYSSDSMHFDEYAFLQAHLDDIDLPASVEAPIPWISVGPIAEAPLPPLFAGPGVEVPKPWFPVGPSVGAPLFSAGHAGDSVNGSYSLQMGEAQLADKNSSLQHLADYKESSAAGSSKLKNKLYSRNLVSGLDLSSESSSSQTLLAEKFVGSEPGGISPNSFTFSNKGSHVASSGSFFDSPGYKFQSSVSNGDDNIFSKTSTPKYLSNNGGAADPNSHGGSSHLNGAGGSQFSPISHSYLGMPDHFSSIGLHASWVEASVISAVSKFTSPSSVYSPSHNLPDPPKRNASRTPRSVDRDDALGKLQLFKRFDTVEDYSDHQYKGSSAKNAQKNWAKKIQEEWRILENDLPEAIYVRAYETRMDLLRAVIVGADGTPYHDGLFFFDIHFPPQYPNVPPRVHYHSGGVRLNPNLYACGKVCLSLLGTWHGNANESWQPGTSTALQVLVSIQALILNQKPYFNEPGFERSSGTPQGEKQSEQYNESTFLLSLKTMTYTLRKPPKHFEDFVLGHFHKHAHDILVACKSYIDGAQVGSLVKGGIQDVDEGNKSCSQSFKTSLPAHMDILAQEFLQIGVKDCEQYCQVAKETIKSSGSVPKKAAKRVKGLSFKV